MDGWTIALVVVLVLLCVAFFVWGTITAPEPAPGQARYGRTATKVWLRHLWAKLRVAQAERRTDPPPTRGHVLVGRGMAYVWHHLHRPVRVILILCVYWLVIGTLLSWLIWTQWRGYLGFVSIWQAVVLLIPLCMALGAFIGVGGSLTRLGNKLSELSNHPLLLSEGVGLLGFKLFESRERRLEREHELRLKTLEYLSAYDIADLQSMTQVEIERLRAAGGLSATVLGFLAEEGRIYLTQQEDARVRQWEAEQRAREREHAERLNTAQQRHEAKQARRTYRHQASESSKAQTHDAGQGAAQRKHEAELRAAEREAAIAEAHKRREQEQLMAEAERALKRFLAEMDGRIKREVAEAERTGRLNELTTRLRLEMETLELRFAHEKPGAEQEVLDRKIKLTGRLAELGMINSMPEGYQKEQAFRIWKQGM